MLRALLTFNRDKPSDNPEFEKVSKILASLTNARKNHKTYKTFQNILKKLLFVYLSDTITAIFLTFAKQRSTFLLLPPLLYERRATYNRDVGGME